MNIVVLNQRSLRFTAWPQFSVGKPDGLNQPNLPAFLHPVKTIQDYQKLPTSIQNSACLSELEQDEIVLNRILGFPDAERL
jgi:hypothetical protein